MADYIYVFLSCCETGLGNPAAADDLLTLAAGAHQHFIGDR